MLFDGLTFSTQNSDMNSAKNIVILGLADATKILIVYPSCTRGLFAILIFGQVPLVILPLPIFFLHPPILKLYVNSFFSKD